MNRNEVNSVSEAIMNLIAKHKGEEPALSGYDISKGGGRFGDGNFDMKLSVTPRLSVADKRKAAANTTDNMVRCGVAPAGTPVICGSGHLASKGIIVKARRTRYLIKGNGGKWDGKEFTFPIRETKLDTAPAPA